MCPEVDGNGARGIEGKVDRWNITFDHEPMVKYLKDESGHSVGAFLYTLTLLRL